MIDRSRRGALAAALLALGTLAGCTPQQAAIYGKLMFGLIVAMLVLIPVVFYREWRRRQGR